MHSRLMFSSHLQGSLEYQPCGRVEYNFTMLAFVSFFKGRSDSLYRLNKISLRNLECSLFGRGLA